jgi:hypothetical protein
LANPYLPTAPIGANCTPEKELSTQSLGNIAPAEETIPILGLGPYLAGERGADHLLAEQLR